MKAMFRIVPVIALASVLSGCPQGGVDQDAIPEAAASAEVLFANAVRSSIEDLKTAENPRAAAGSAQYAVEDLEGLEGVEPAQSHLETYQKIKSAFEALAANKQPTKATISEAISELEGLAATLPQ